MQISPMLTCVALTALCATAPAFAEVTGQQVWDAWQAHANEGRETLTARSVRQDGDTLKISGLAFHDETSTVAANVNFGDFSFKDLPDGTVHVVFPETYRMSMDERSTSGLTRGFTMTLVSKGLVFVISGEPDAFTYDLVADEVTFVFGDYVENGERMPTVITMDFKAFDGLLKTWPGPDFIFDFALRAGAAGSKLEASDPAVPGKLVQFGVDLQDMDWTATGKVRAGTSLMYLTEALKAGLDMQVGLTAGASTIYVVDTGEEPVDIKLTSTSSALDLGLAYGGMRYSSSAQNTEIHVDLPVTGPLVAKLDDYKLAFQMPLASSPLTHGVGLVLNLSNLTLDEEIWALFDAGKVLPREPVNLNLDLSGLTKLRVDIMEPGAIWGRTVTPLEIERLDLKDLRFAGAGVDISGSGGLTFDYASAEKGEFPKPTGEISVQTLGLDTLMGNLAKIGLVAEDQVMAMTALSDIYAKPGPKPDSLESLIEFKDGGAIFANGRALQ